jgi:hypothetical protein
VSTIRLGRGSNRHAAPRFAAAYARGAGDATFQAFLAHTPEAGADGASCVIAALIVASRISD